MLDIPVGRKKQGRRLAAEQAIRMAGFETFKDCGDACEKLARSKGLDVTFNSLAIQHYVTCNTNFSVKRMKLLAELLNVKDFVQMDEAFMPPKPRGVGKDWVGDNGTVVKDYDASALIR